MVNIPYMEYMGITVLVADWNLEWVARFQTEVRTFKHTYIYIY